MIIEGNIIKIDGDKVFIKQFWSGYIYQTIRSQVKILGKDRTPTLVNGKPVGRIDGIGCNPDIIANRIK